MLRKASFLTTVAALALAGCTDTDAPLQGERLNVREVLQTRSQAEAPAPENASVAVSLPAMTSNGAWPQSYVSPHARVAHAALGANLSPIWATSIGAGDGRRARVVVDPVMADGRIFTVDSNNMVQATATSGEVLWTYDLTPLRDQNYQAQGGGLAVGGGQLFVSSGFGTLTALDPATGAENWTQRLGATATGKPSWRDGVVYVVSGDTTGWAIEDDDGRVRWQFDVPSDVNNVAGGPAPAISDKFVTFSFGSSSVATVFRQGGLRLWSADILGRRNGVALANVQDITGDPVVSGGMLYAGTHSGRMVGLSLYDGERKWTAQQGALGPAAVAGNALFFVSDRNQLVRLNAEDGSQVWAVDLPGYEPSRNPNRRRDAAFVNSGPVLAGGRLIVAGSDGLIRSFAPEDGALVSSLEIAGGATTRPIVAGGVMYVVSAKGMLHAYR
ncbi:PQQ-binding-like beta-propeller repeat protein [Tropicibacter naphthalenivorans]|uniref:Outer membrane protein assembly factor BamB n=1 Tax=Tropicibacter naphthalenivorans TaxID=441103 RepID=A0A0P1G4L5_9RHOB|nr:PQQ-binding-like beta-propeller repeat protein [Tropicibacter naphthalenivorans]CUH76678.1 Outer membrane protein assembly factor BamB precursor [Tropicibacter naphthalenivorans]SMC64153.1 Outer membrane protein assembly factor BamB, contains PQQ-like beta-propeller repeat [Tropicibacter naphthalenivorans]